MDEPLQVWTNHSQLYRRLRKTLYYGHTKKPIVECSSLPLTEVTVELIEKSIARQRKCLGNLDVNYAAHILHQACISPASIMIAMIYLDRLKSINPTYVRQTSPSELFLVSLVVASKFLFDKGEDEIVYNDEWATFGNLDIEDLNQLEREFLDALNWSCFVDQASFVEQLIKFEALVSIKEYLKRSYSNLTYTELLSLFDYLKFRYNKGKDDAPLWEDLTDFAKSICICVLAYCAAVSIILMSFSIVFSIHYAMSPHHSFEIQENSTLQLVSFDSIVFDIPISNPQTLLTFAIRQNKSTQSQNEINYHFLLRQKYNKFLKCS